MNGPRSRPRGFTMIELVTTMVIIGILAVFAVGRMDFTNVFAQRGVRDKLRAGIEYARKSAVAKRRHVCVTLDESAHTVTLKFDTRTPESAAAPYCAGGANLNLPAPDRDCGGSSGNVLCSTSDATIGGSTTSLVFDAQGTPSAAAAYTVTGQSDVTVEAATGYVH